MNRRLCVVSIEVKFGSSLESVLLHYDRNLCPDVLAFIERAETAHGSGARRAKYDYNSFSVRYGVLEDSNAGHTTKRYTLGGNDTLVVEYINGFEWCHTSDGLGARLLIFTNTGRNITFERSRSYAETQCAGGLTVRHVSPWNQLVGFNEIGFHEESSGGGPNP